MSIRNTTLDDVACIIGFSATLRLSAWYGDGNNLYVPLNPEPNSKICRLIGEPAARRLSAEFGGSHLAIPRLKKYDEDLRKKMVARLVEQRFGTREISTMLRITERRILQIVRELEQEGFIEPIAPSEKPPRNLLEEEADEI